MGTITRDAAVQVWGLTKDYGGVGVFDLDLTVQRGTAFGFLGPNGAGKSTTLRLLVDFARPDSGAVRVLGLDPYRSGSAVRARVGFLPAELALWRIATARRALDHLAALRGGVDEAYRAELCERFGVELDRPLRELSTGNKQKIGLVQAFMHRPELVVLDEPTTGLDPLVQQELHALVGEVTHAGATVLLSSHALSEVERVADMVAVLREGRLATEASMSELKRLAVRHVRAELAGHVDPALFRDLDGVADVVLDAGLLTATVTGHVDPLVKALARTTVQSLIVEEGDLEEIFLGLYRDAPERVAADLAPSTGRTPPLEPVPVAVTEDLPAEPAQAYPGAARGASERLVELLRWNVRERLRLTALSGVALMAVTVMVFALYPAVSASLGEFDLPTGVANLLGGASFSTLPGWLNTEVVSIMLPFGLLMFGAALGAGWLAGQEEQRTAAVVLATPVSRRALLIAATLSAVVLVVALTALCWLGFVLGDALVADDLSRTGVLALLAHVATLGVFGATLALAVGALTGRRIAALATVGAVGVLSFLIAGFAPTVPSLSWLRHLSVFSLATGHDPLRHGLSGTGLLAVLLAAGALFGVAWVSWPRRDLRL